MHVLIVDDNASEVARKLEAVRVCKVVCTTSGADAVRALTRRGTGFDLVIVNARLPDMDGADLFDAVSRLPWLATQRPPFLFVASRAHDRLPRIPEVVPVVAPEALPSVVAQLVATMRLDDPSP